MAPNVGDGGVGGWGLITTVAEGKEVHPPILVIVKLYVPTLKPDIVILVVFPGIEPGLII